MTAPGPKPVVVGVDGSSSALDAAQWAAAEAVRRGTWLRIVFCDVLAQMYLPDLPMMPPPQTYSEALARQAQVWLHRAKEEAQAAAPAVEARTFVRTGDAASVLIEESREAQLMVVGSRGLGGFAGSIVGSVAVALCTHGRCPVAVVRRPATDVGPDAAVVVGVDVRNGQELVLTAAFEAAAMRNAPLVVVHAWHEAGSEQAWYSFHAEGRGAAVQAEEERFLAETMAGWGEKYPDVAVRRLVMHSRPARALLEQAEHAQLVVVGTRGRGGFTGLLLGSTSQQLVYHAPCPLLVAR